MSPDDFAGRCLGELYPAEVLNLAQVWPAAYEAAIEVLMLADNGQIPMDSSDFDLPLTTLVQQRQFGDF